ncbi:MAG: DNA methylase, partial [Lachnospiraceae bacterium]|nr:DNA methylase [Lachnospiraceae bacterium]
DHAWGIEPVTMADIKSYRSGGHSLSNGQVLPRPYRYGEARLVMREMTEVLCADLFAKNLVTRFCTWWVSYDYKSLEEVPAYDGPLSIDFYGRLHPRHTGGTARLPRMTNHVQTIAEALLKQFDEKTDHRLLYRRLWVCAGDVREDLGIYQMDLFTDYETLERDRRLQGAMLEVRRRYGANAVFKGMNLLEGATTLERNRQIGGHRA